MKEACAAANHRLGKLDNRRFALIQGACQAILAGELGELPPAVWQTGSGTQTNMNCNEVIARWGNLQAGEDLLHPNDHVNLSQSSNDTFPTALTSPRLLPSTGGSSPPWRRCWSAFKSWRTPTGTW